MKVVGAGLEGFGNWVDPIPPIGETQGIRPIPQISSELVEESEDDMSSLAAGFAKRMLK